MTDLYIGKFSSNYPEQVEERFYAAGAEGADWYGGIKPGDYVFPVFSGKINELWCVKEYTKKENKINKDGVVVFELVKTFKEPIRLSDEFIRYRYFEPDLNLLNKSAKSVKNCGFIKITVSKGCPEPDSIEFRNNFRNVFIALDGEKLILDERDFGIIINNIEEGSIKGIYIYEDGQLKIYESLSKLYDIKNEEKYSLPQLLEYAEIDNASKKKNYLESVISDLKENGKFIVSNPIALYDNVLVGRKKSAPSKTKVKIDSTIEDVEFVEEEETNPEEAAEFQKYVDLLKFNPNMILYGPPGTGKTYSTAKIIEYMDINYSNKHTSFETIEKDGRVKFITFHQSYSYEEFIEGIRPQINDDEDSEQGTGIKYKVEDGILKQLANLASMQVLKADKRIKGTEIISEKSRIWKISLGSRNKDEKIYNECIARNDIAIGWLNDINLKEKNYEEVFDLLKIERGVNGKKPFQDADSVYTFISEIQIGDVVFIYDGPRTIRDIGVVEGEYDYKPELSYSHRRSIKWIKHYNPGYDIYAFNGQTILTLKTVYQLHRINFTDLNRILKEDESNQVVVRSEAKIAPYYLIIDEINRGNISKIFGELITLIEKDKRGKINCVLPYSKKPFTLPENLYIIGTMNTADRSIALLDTALRRRFVFVEIEPDIKLFDNPNVVISPKVNNTIDLGKLLNALNIKIVKKLDREHRIGHAYFIDIISMGDLYKVWYYKILPLLMEYFYGDIESLKAITGKEFFDDMGSIIFISYKEKSGGISEFEAALLKICQAGNANE
ncbi:AAA family ATPase [Clostridium sp.]|uniref:AAA family ATPase n=1 Tax=Clostridium sp. TaxID=1506 RepID=UPI003D6CB054